MFSISLTTNTPCRSRPWVNGLLLLANAAVFAGQMADPTLMRRYMLAMPTIDLPRFLTYAFVHVNAWHLAFNLPVLYVLGGGVNDRLGPVGYLAFYLGGGVFAGIGFILAGGDAVVGASGAIGAVMGGYLALLPKSQIVMRFFGFSAYVPSLYLIVIYFLYNLVMSLSGGVTTQEVAYAAHVAGMVFGFVVCLGLMGVRLVPRQAEDLLGLVRSRLRRRPAGEG
jgi:membrane associated rhomboid family serine protease